jgi:NAD(P)-dependent dehydrogenase (short-subunit alcohol dehydrogenase family)
MNDYLNMFSLSGKTAVITGGTGILGRDIVLALGSAGAKVAICYHQTDAGELMDDLRNKGIDAKSYYIDVMKKDKIIECHDKIMSDIGKIDILVNAAGGNVKNATTSEELSFFDLPLEGLNKVVALNLFGGAILTAQVFGKTMAKNKEGGSIINISSMAAFRPLTRIPGYSAAKAAVSSFTQWLAVHFAQEYNKNLRVNGIAPGFFLTRQNHFLLFNKNEKLTDRGKTIISHTPMDRFGKPEDLAGVTVWLASDASKFVSGIVIPIDGGFSSFSGV